MIPFLYIRPFLSFSVFHSLFLFRSFDLSSCRLPFVSYIAFFAFTFASLLSLVAYSVCYFVSALDHPPRSLRAWSMRIPLACCLLLFLSCVANVELSLLLLLFSSLPSLFRFRFGQLQCLFSSCLVLVGTCCLLGFGFCCDSFSILAWYI